ncbi:MAG: hypothetical protein AABX54_04940 [Nanoarchaeota archaeon]
MNNIFEIIDKSGRRIHLSKERWGHIRIKHPNVDNFELIKDTIINPIDIIIYEEDIRIFYKYFKHQKGSLKYLKVLVKYLNGNGYVISSYFIKNIV